MHFTRIALEAPKFSYYNWESNERAPGRAIQSPQANEVEAMLANANKHHEAIALNGRPVSSSTKTRFGQDSDLGAVASTFFNSLAAVFAEFRVATQLTKNYKKLNNSISVLMNCKEMDSEYTKKKKENEIVALVAFSGITKRTALLVADRKVVKREMVNSYLIAAAKTIVFGALLVFAGAFVYESVLGVVISAGIGAAGIGFGYAVKFCNRNIDEKNLADFGIKKKNQADFGIKDPIEVEEDQPISPVKKYNMNRELVIDSDTDSVENFFEWYLGPAPIPESEENQ
jgi:hypothetical protein